MQNMVLIFFCAVHVFEATSAIGVPSEDVSANDCVPDASNVWIGARASCTFERRIDFREDRCPKNISYVKCKCPRINCSYKGDFQCVEVTTRFEVVYRAGMGWTIPTEIVLPTSCVCVTPMVNPAKTSTRVHYPDVSPAPLEMPVSQSNVRNHSERIYSCKDTCISRCMNVRDHFEIIYSCAKNCTSMCDVAHHGTE